MSVIKSLWAMVQGDPVFMRRVNGWLTVVWLIMVPVAITTGWIYSIAFISAISIYANVAGHLAAWQASRVETVQDQDANVQDVLDVVKQIREDLR
jgi:hypothetical protein